MKPLIIAALLALAGCAPMTPEESAQWAQFANGMAGAAAQQQQQADAEFYYRQQLYMQQQQLQQLQQINSAVQAQHTNWY